MKLKRLFTWLYDATLIQETLTFSGGGGSQKIVDEKRWVMFLWTLDQGCLTIACIYR